MTKRKEWKFSMFINWSVEKESIPIKNIDIETMPQNKPSQSENFSILRTISSKVWGLNSHSLIELRWHKMNHLMKQAQCIMATIRHFEGVGVKRGQLTQCFIGAAIESTAGLKTCFIFNNNGRQPVIKWNFKVLHHYSIVNFDLFLVT